MNVGDRVYISGEVFYGDKHIRVASYGTLIHVGMDACMVNIDMIDGDANAWVIVKNKFISKRNVG